MKIGRKIATVRRPRKSTIGRVADDDVKDAERGHRPAVRELMRRFVESHCENGRVSIQICDFFAEAFEKILAGEKADIALRLASKGRPPQDKWWRDYTLTISFLWLRCRADGADDYLKRNGQPNKPGEIVAWLAKKYSLEPRAVQKIVKANQIRWRCDSFNYRAEYRMSGWTPEFLHALPRDCAQDDPKPGVPAKEPIMRVGSI